MKRQRCGWIGLAFGVLLTASGCLVRKPDFTAYDDDLSHYQAVAAQIESPDLATPGAEVLASTPPPRALRESGPVEYWDMTLQEAVHLALTQSEILRDLGGTVLRAPAAVRTPYGPAIEESDPRFGVEGALSAFDTQFSTEMFFEKNDRRLNNEALGQNGFFQQDLDIFQAELTKRAATGSQFALRKNVEFDNDSSAANTFSNGAWNVNLEGEVRHPLLRNGGLLFNRIAGPGAQPGASQGVLIARVRTDVSLADFELALRDFLSNVENAYWDLYFAYRDLDVKIRARNTGLYTWQVVETWQRTGREGGEAEKEAQAREQYFRFEQEVQDALTGRLLEGTRTNNGSTPGTFRGFPGVHLHERKLRLLLGLPVNGQRLIRPIDEPPKAPVEFDWPTMVTMALARRAELRRQQWQVKRRELELVAARNHLLPNLDLVGRYRWRGFGEKLIDADTHGQGRFDNAFMSLTSGDFQEWLLGAEFSLPIGFRQAHAAVRNAQLQLAQANSILREQQRQVVHDLSNAVAEVQRAYVTMQTAFNRHVAAQRQLEILQYNFRHARKGVRPEFFVVLDAQRRAADAEIRYYQAEVEYALALRNVQFEKGTLLDYLGVELAEGPWPAKAYADAAELEQLRGRARPLSYVLRKAPIVSQGPYPQQTLMAPPPGSLSPTPLPNLPAAPVPPPAERQAPEGPAG